MIEYSEIEAILAKKEWYESLFEDGKAYRAWHDEMYRQGKLENNYLTRERLDKWTLEIKEYSFGISLISPDPLFRFLTKGLQEKNIYIKLYFWNLFNGHPVEPYAICPSCKQKYLLDGAWQKWNGDSSLASMCRDCCSRHY